MKKEIAGREDLFAVLDFMEDLDIIYWLDGGWGVDALAGKQTRAHRDIDIDFDSRHTDRLLSALFAAGYQIEVDWRPVRIELCHPERGYLDIHPFILAEDGTAKQADLEGGWYVFEAGYFGRTVFAGRNIPCISAEGQKVFHTGYEPREVDMHDMKIIERILKEGGRRP